MQAELWIACAACVAVAVLAGWADRRRAHAEGMARVGWVPWSGLTMLALFAAAGAMVLAMKAG